MFSTLSTVHFKVMLFGIGLLSGSLNAVAQPPNDVIDIQQQILDNAIPPVYIDSTTPIRHISLVFPRENGLLSARLIDQRKLPNTNKDNNQWQIEYTFAGPEQAMQDAVYRLPIDSSAHIIAMTVHSLNRNQTQHIHHPDTSVRLIQDEISAHDIVIITVSYQSNTTRNAATNATLALAQHQKF